VGAPAIPPPLCHQKNGIVGNHLTLPFHPTQVFINMLPWFIYLLILFGRLQSPEQWNTLTPSEQQELEYIIGEDVHG
jgi:hypothetical protein